MVSRLFNLSQRLDLFLCLSAFITIQKKEIVTAVLICVIKKYVSKAK